MWGGMTDPGPTGADGDPMTHMAAATAEADRQVGKIMAELEAQDELDNTLVVLTADHGSVAGQAASTASRSPTRDYGYYNWYYGDPENDAVLQPAAGRPAAAGRHRQRRALLQRLDAAGLAQGPVRRPRSTRRPRRCESMAGRHRRVAPRTATTTTGSPRSAGTG